MLEIGKKIPAFTLLNHDGRKVKLSDHKGRKILLFAYPKAATSGCTKQACGFRDSFRDIAGTGCVVLGLSPDSVEKLKKWRDRENFGYDLLSDPDHAVLEKYGAWGEKKLYGKTYFGVIRSHWIIDQDGKLLDQQLKVTAAQSIERALAFLTKGG